MSTYIPNYYNKFKCIASKCRHSCCKGWEIDIDSDTLDYYSSLDTTFGKSIRQTISFDGTPHFILGDDESCPHLKDNGLCSIICELGEGALCQICRDHPRFYNFFDSFTECGIGLCCEEAARIILSENESFTILSYDNDEQSFTSEEALFLEERQQIFNLLCQRQLTVKERFSAICKKYSFDFESLDTDALICLYLKLERLDNRWTDILEGLKNHVFDKSILENDEFSLYFQQLCCYFIYRHLADGLYENNTAQRVLFCVSACVLLGAVFDMHTKAFGSITLEKIADYARMFSSEVEYSDENMEFLFENTGSFFKLEKQV